MKNNIEILPTKEYQWNHNWNNRIAYTDINLVVAELEAIQEVRGTITPEFIVESAKNKKSTIHDYFEWDDEKAAHTYRLRQASQLLTRIEVKIIKNGEPRIIRAFEINSKEPFESATYLIHTTTTTTTLIVKACIEDLNRVKNKLFGHNINKPIQYINKAIEELQKEDVKTLKPELTKAV